MDILQAIDIRKSRRKYLQTKIDIDKLQKIYNLIDICNKEGNLSIKVIEDASDAFKSIKKSYGMFSGVKTVIVLSGKADDKNLEEKVGCYGERIVLEATELGLGTCWVGASYDKCSNIFKISEDERMVCVITIGNVEMQKGIKEKIIYKMIHHSTKAIESFYECDKQPPEWFIKGIEAVQKAPSALNKQPVKFKYFDGKVTAEVDDSESYRLIDLGIAKCHFDIVADGRFNLGNGSQFIKVKKDL